MTAVEKQQFFCARRSRIQVFMIRLSFLGKQTVLGNWSGKMRFKYLPLQHSCFYFQLNAECLNFELSNSCLTN